MVFSSIHAEQAVPWQSALKLSESIQNVLRPQTGPVSYTHLRAHETS